MSLEDVAVVLRQVLGLSERAREALGTAARFAQDATVLMTEVGHGSTDIVQSGREADGEHKRINNYFVEQQLVDRKGSAEASKHVEIKVAWRQRQGGVDRVEPTVDNEVCLGPLGCDTLLPFVLRPGQTLVVHDPVRSIEFRGRTPQ